MNDRSLVSLFSGIGGFEVAARSCGLTPALLCEVDNLAQAVLRNRFPTAEVAPDVRRIDRLPRKTWLVTAGFPCQDLSSVGPKHGIRGSQSSLVDEVFRLLEHADPDWVVLENVMFMLHLGKGAAMEHVVGGLEDLGFNWAYRLLNTSNFGIPQRRRRVYFVASRKHDAVSALFDEHEPNRADPERKCLSGSASYGFYWTEGTYATGITENGVPPLKTGSTIGIPSPPAIILSNGTVGTPTIGDAERLQGFRKGWTRAVAGVGRESFRWKLVGNAVSVPVARHVIRGVLRATGAEPAQHENAEQFCMQMRKWPDAAFGRGGRRYAMPNNGMSGMKPHVPIQEFLSENLKPLSAKATWGFLRRAQRGRLSFPDGFLDRLEAHAWQMERQL